MDNRFAIDEDSCSTNAITFHDKETGRLFVIMGETEDYTPEQIMPLVELLNKGAAHGGVSD